MIKIEYENKTIAIIIPSEYEKEGIHFFTPDDYSQQLAYMKRPKQYKIKPHIHNHVQRAVFNTLETIFIRKGRVRVDIYTEEKIFFKSSELNTGDVMLLVSGGHGFEMIEESEMIEVKQGPYAGDMDKERFEP
jgi:hypothetical protein